MQKADSEWRHHALIEVKHLGVESEVDVKKNASGNLLE